jgi:hypothetical protein
VRPHLIGEINEEGLEGEARKECLPRSLRPRCLAREMRNLQSKTPADFWTEFKARAMVYYQAASRRWRLLRDDIAANLTRDLPAAVDCLDDDFETRITHPRFPPGDPHHGCLNGCSARNGGAPRDPACFRRACRFKADVSRAHACGGSADRWRGSKVSEFEHRQLQAIRDEIDKDLTPTMPQQAGATTIPTLFIQQ